MKCVSALSTERNTEAALARRRRAARLNAWRATPPTSPWSSLRPTTPRRSGGSPRTSVERGLARHVLGCTGESIVGDDQEVEGRRPSASGRSQLPGVAVQPLRIVYDEARACRAGPPSADSQPRVRRRRPRRPILLGDPFTFPTDQFLKRLNESRPAGLRVVGGMASGGHVARAEPARARRRGLRRRRRGGRARRRRCGPHGRQPGVPADRPADDRDQGRAERHPRPGPAARAGGAPRDVRRARPRTTRSWCSKACTSAG